VPANADAQARSLSWSFVRAAALLASLSRCVLTVLVLDNDAHAQDKLRWWTQQIRKPAAVTAGATAGTGTRTATAAAAAALSAADAVFSGPAMVAAAAAAEQKSS
jgi:hypothetical protein